MIRCVPGLKIRTLTILPVNPFGPPRSTISELWKGRIEVPVV